MDIPSDGRTRILAAARQTPPAKRPAGWSRLGLAAFLGLVAGAVLFPKPANGREDTDPAP